MAPKFLPLFRASLWALIMKFTFHQPVYEYILPCFRSAPQYYFLPVAVCCRSFRIDRILTEDDQHLFQVPGQFFRPLLLFQHFYPTFQGGNRSAQLMGCFLSHTRPSPGFVRSDTGYGVKNSDNNKQAYNK